MMEEPVPAVPKMYLVNFQEKGYPEMVPEAGNPGHPGTFHALQSSLSSIPRLNSRTNTHTSSSKVAGAQATAMALSSWTQA